MKEMAKRLQDYFYAGTFGIYLVLLLPPNLYYSRLSIPPFICFRGKDGRLKEGDGRMKEGYEGGKWRQAVSVLVWPPSRDSLPPIILRPYLGWPRNNLECGREEPRYDSFFSPTTILSHFSTKPISFIIWRGMKWGMNRGGEGRGKYKPKKQRRGIGCKLEEI